MTIDPKDRFLIVNTKTGRALESWPTEYQARHFCGSLNEHERDNGRPQNWQVVTRSIDQ